MGINAHLCKLVLEQTGHLSEVKSVLLLGRQCFFVRPALLKSLISPHSSKTIQDYYQEDGFSETFFLEHGVQKVDSIDFSDFEKANLVLDLGSPIPKSLYNTYDLIIDGGTLEHVFNFPVAIQNCFNLLKKNGLFISETPTNNQSGHGFYQFSPELYFSLGRSVSGLVLKDLFVWEGYESSPWYRVTDPDLISQRVCFTNAIPTYIGVVMQKTEEEVDFSGKIYQTDYLKEWVVPTQRQDGRSTFRKNLPQWLKDAYRYFWNLFWINLCTKLTSVARPYPKNKFRKVRR